MRPRSWCSCDEAVAVGVLDQHHGGVRHVDADLDHRRGDEHVAPHRRRTRAIAACLSRGRQAAVQQHHLEVARAPSCAAARTRRWRHAPGAPRTPRPAGTRRTPGAPRSAPRGCARRRGRARASLAATSVVDRPPARRQLAQDGDVEIAVGGQRERPRDRRGRHVQHVRGEPVRRLAVQRAALVDAEAVLLVDDRDGEPVELDGPLDQRVRADEELQLAGGELAEDVGAPARAAWIR